MFTFNHFNFNVFDLNKSMEFYSKALGLKEEKKHLTEAGYLFISVTEKQVLHWSLHG